MTRLYLRLHLILPRSTWPDGSSLSSVMVLWGHICELSFKRNGSVGSHLRVMIRSQIVRCSVCHFLFLLPDLPLWLQYTDGRRIIALEFSAWIFDRSMLVMQESCCLVRLKLQGRSRLVRLIKVEIEAKLDGIVWFISVWLYVISLMRSLSNEYANRN